MRKTLRFLACLVVLSVVRTVAVYAVDLEAYPSPEEDGFFGFKADMEPRGPRVSFVFDDGPADEAGLRPGDLILTLAGKPLAGLRHDQLHELVAPYRVGDRVPLEVGREDRVLSLTITLGPTPPEHRTSPEARERFHQAMREHEALEQLFRLIRSSSVLLVRPAEDQGHLVRAERDGAEWETLHPKLLEILDGQLRGAVSEVEGSRVLRIQAEQKDDGIHFQTLRRR